MLQALPLFIGLRYIFSSNKHTFLSIVFSISMLGIGLGVAILIIVLSIMNGSITTLRSEVLKSVPHLTVSYNNRSLWSEQLIQQLLNLDNIEAVAPFVEGEAAISKNGATQFIRVRGVDPLREESVVTNVNSTYGELLEDLGLHNSGLIMGYRLLGIVRQSNSDEVRLNSLNRLVQRDLNNAKAFSVLGGVDLGIYGSGDLALISLSSAEKLFGNAEQNEFQLRLKLTDLGATDLAKIEVIKVIKNFLVTLSDKEQEVVNLKGTTWRESEASLFNALQMEKFLTSIMLSMIVIIGAVNIVSTLIMMVSEKKADIAILRTMGISRFDVSLIFIVQGFVVGLFGAFLGVVVGVLVTLNLTDIGLALETLASSFSSEKQGYFLSHLKAELVWLESMLIAVGALGVSIAATLYPAVTASKVMPVDVLRYE
jgi:lipoprotein-releasing system permease protein